LHIKHLSSALVVDDNRLTFQSIMMLKLMPLNFITILWYFLCNRVA